MPILAHLVPRLISNNRLINRRKVGAAVGMREAHAGGATGEAGSGGGNAPLDELGPALPSSAAGRSHASQFAIANCETRH